MADEKKVIWGPDNPHPLSQMKTELVWDGKYDEYGRRREVDVAGYAMPIMKKYFNPVQGIEMEMALESILQLEKFFLCNSRSANEALHNTWIVNRWICGDNDRPESAWLAKGHMIAFCPDVRKTQMLGNLL